MASQKQQQSSTCGKCSRRVVKVGICCEGDCGRWFHPRCIGMSDEEYQRWGKSAEEWRCEVCSTTKETVEDSTANADVVRDTSEAGNKVNAVQLEGGSEEELNEGVEVDTSIRDRANGRKTARNEAVASTIEMFTKRVFYREEEIEKILQEQYRVSREKQGARDTNVTQSVRSMKGEVQQQLDHERTRDQMINVELLMQLWPNMGELIMHLVRRVEDLEEKMIYKDKRIEVLAKKIQVLERKGSESPLSGNMNEDNKSTEVTNGSRAGHKDLEANEKKDQDLIGDPVILRQRRWFRSTWSKRDGNVNSEEKRRGNNLHQKGMRSKNGNRWNKWPKNRDRWSNSVTTNWKMKKSVCAVENVDRNRQTTKNSIEGSQMISNTAKNTMRKSDTEENMKWNKKLDRLQEAIVGLEKIIAQRGVVAHLSPVS